MREKGAKVSEVGIGLGDTSARFRRYLAKVGDEEAVESAPKTRPDTVPDVVLDGGQYDHSFSDPIIEQTGIDDVVLGAPLATEDSSTMNEAPYFPTGDPVFSAAPNLRSTEPPHPLVMVGCVWDGDNWSCAYDAVLMSFWSIYKKASPNWHSKWREQAPKWNNFFGAAFASLLTTAQDEQTSRASLSRKFTSFRETFRNELSQVNPEYFRRHGKVTASVCRILSHIFSRDVVREPHLDQLVACDPCGVSMYCRCSFALLGSSDLLNRYLDEDDIGERLPLQVAVTRYVQCASLEPQRDRCRTCSGLLRVESLSLPETMWLWIELADPTSPITPSTRLVFGAQDPHRVYTLQAVIYHGGNHFTARLLDQSATWWDYNGMSRFGEPHIDYVEDDGDLLENNGRHAAFLLYCRADLHD